MKKTLMLIAVIVCLSVFMAACDKDFKVTLDFDSSMGSLSIVGEKDAFNKDEDVKVKVEPNENYELNSLLVNGEDVTTKIVGGEYTFKISKNTTVKAEFKAKSSNPQNPGPQNPDPQGPGSQGSDHNTESEEKGALVLNYDKSLVSINVEPKKDSYAKGDQVTVTVEPLDRCSVTEVKLNDDKIKLNKCKYSFTIEEKATLSVEAEKSIYLTTNYDSTKGSLVISPKKTYYTYNESVTITVRPKKDQMVRSFFVGGVNHIGDSANYSCTVNMTKGMCIDVEFKDKKEYITFLNSDTYDEAVKTGKVLVEFGAVWCGPCRYLVPLLEDLNELAIPDVKCYRVDIDECRDLAIEFNTTNVPVLLIYENGEIKQRNEGWSSDYTLEYLMELAEINL